MKEQVGVCVYCSKTIYCRDGFLEGVVDQVGRLVCFNCQKTVDEKPDPKDTSL